MFSFSNTVQEISKILNSFIDNHEGIAPTNILSRDKRYGTTWPSFLEYLPELKKFPISALNIDFGGANLNLICNIGSKPMSSCFGANNRYFHCGGGLLNIIDEGFTLKRVIQFHKLIYLYAIVL